VPGLSREHDRSLQTGAARAAPAPGYRRRWQLDGGVLVAGVAVAAVGMLLADHAVSALEERVFRLFNDLPDWLQVPAWVVQLPGVLLVPLGLAAVAALVRRWRLALGLALLVPVKLAVEYGVIKALVDRERPATSLCGGDLTCLHLRGAPASGISIPSGHAMIALATWWLVAPYLSRRAQWITLGTCLLVPAARMYLGAHNPLDVLVGAAAGVAVAAGLNLLVGVPDRSPEAPRRGDAGVD
jgi:undecaprenyl-diphosphatase